jgi:16S rRNA (guanine527-N7)-methyltransferase
VPELERQLAEGLDRLGLDLAIAPDLLAFVALLSKWNRVFNLTAVREPAQMVSRHLLDSLGAVPYLQGGRVLDVGSGAGLPGIPLAIAEPGRDFVLLDSSLKRTRFLVQAVSELKLANVSVVRARIEDYDPEALFDTAVARAYARIDKLIADAGHCLRSGARFIAMKGREPADELAELPRGYHIAQIVRVPVPGLEAERHLIILVKDR